MPFLQSSPLNYPTNSFSSIKRFKLDRAPTSGDYKNFDLGDEWLDLSSDDWWKLCEKGISSGTWRKMAGTSAAAENFVVDSGTSPVEPDSLNEITITGGILTETVGSLNTITINSSAFGFFIPDTGTSPVIPDSSGQVTMIGGNGIQTTGGTNALTFNMFPPYIGDFEFRSETSGDTETLLISNTSNTVDSQAFLQLQVAGSAAGDPWMNFNISGEKQYSFGIRNTTNQLKITDGGTVNTGTNWFILDPAAIGGDGSLDLPVARLNISKTIGAGDLVLNVENQANSPNSNAYVIVETGGNTGDPFIRYNLADSWATGVDNSDGNSFKITYAASNASPSTGIEALAMDTTGAVTFANAFTFPITDGTAGQTLVTDGAGTVTWQTERSIGEVAQYLYAANANVITVPTTPGMPWDDTIPQQSEGIEIITLTITPKSATNRLVFKASGWGMPETISQHTIALFQDTTNNALSANAIGSDNFPEPAQIAFNYSMLAGTTSSTTFKIRIGRANGAQLYINAQRSGTPGNPTRVFGGTSVFTFEIWEITQ